MLERVWPQSSPVVLTKLRDRLFDTFNLCIACIEQFLVERE